MILSENPRIELVNADCMEIMRTLPDKAFDLAIVDPPYGINAPKMNMGSNSNRNEPGQYSGISTATKLRGRLNGNQHPSSHLKDRILCRTEFSWDNEKPIPEYFEQLFRISKNQIVWGGNYFPELWGAGFSNRAIAVWNKNQPWDNFSQCELAWTSFDYPAKVYTLSNRGGNNELKKIHPTEKPAHLYEWILTQYAKPGDKIIDTHAGSLSHGIACHKMRFDLFAIEKDINYFDSSIKRFNEITAQQKLF